MAGVTGIAGLAALLPLAEQRSLEAAVLHRVLSHLPGPRARAAEAYLREQAALSRAERQG